MCYNTQAVSFNLIFLVQTRVFSPRWYQNETTIDYQQLIFVHYSENKIAYIYLKTANRISLSKKVVCNHMIALKSQYFNFQKKKATIGKTMVTEGAYFRLNLFQIPYRYLTFILATTQDIDSHTWIIVRESFLGDKLRCSGETSHQRKNYSWQQRVIPNVKLEVT